MNHTAVLTAYSQGTLSRSVAMRHLGIDWYGDLLVLLNHHGIARPRISSEDEAVMHASMLSVFNTAAREAAASDPEHGVHDGTGAQTEGDE
ncbi:MAG TPA: hypothetical protein VM512_14355 [Burkholderiaceae bacterium]|jgi:hypothetical protein|nr:hypothetical protein [Burkholderiaceae bacterium]